MVERVLFKSEQMSSRAEVASYLRTVADKLDNGESLTLESGGDSTNLEVPNTVEFEVKAEHEGPSDAGELSVEFELEWDVDGDDGPLEIK